MNLIPGICTQCGATLSVDKEKDAMVCPYCGTPFIVEKAIQHFNTTYQITNHINAQNVYIQNENSGFEIVGGILKKYTGADVDVVIPDGVLKIGRNAFRETMIRSVRMPDSVLEIEGYAFCGCTLLESIELPSKLNLIGNSAFWGCESLTKIELPSGLNNLGGNQEIPGSGAFSDCSNLETVSLSSNLLRSGGYSTSAFICCPKLRNIYVDGVKLEEDDEQYLPYFPDTEPGYRAVARIQRRKQVEQWKRARLCQHCGGAFTGIFTSKCSKCGKPKDYMDMLYEDS